MTNVKKNSFFGQIDWVTIWIWLALCLIGWFNIHAAVYDPDQASLFNLNTNYGKQSIFIFTALIIGFVILLIDTNFFITSSPFLYFGVVLLLVTVLLVGRSVGGNQSWIPLGSFRLQPSEFAKLATCLLLSFYLSSQASKVPSTKTLIFAAIIVIIPIALVLLQKDTGSALVFTSLIFVFYREGYVGSNLLILIGVSIVLFVLSLLFNEWVLIGILAFIAGVLAFLGRKKQKNILRVGGFFVAAAIFVLSVEFIFNDILQPHHRGRIDVIIGKLDDPRDIGYNLNQSLIAIGSGQLFGKGYLQGTQTKYNFVPEQSTDFIFCTVGEEWGFIGGITVIGIYLFLLLRLVNIAERQRNTFARIYGYGVVSVLFFHFLINIGMTIGLVPVIGIPLPFLSYGGSSLWSFTILLFVLLKFDSSRKGISTN